MKILIVVSVILLILIAAFLTIVPPSRGRVPQFKDADGKVLPNSIAEKTYVEIDGAKIGMFIVGKDVSNPVLLFCGGGPGIPQYLLESFWPSELPNHFVVCYFDYRGTGLSFDSKVSPADMTTERYLQDVDAITGYLQERFMKEKIYIMAQSFGTYIALNAVERHPEKYEAYLAVSQVCNQPESEYRAYDYMCSEYEKLGDKKMVSELAKYPIRESKEIFDKYTKSGIRDKAMHKLGVGTTRDMDSVITGIFFPSLRCKAYTISERINIWRGKFNSHKFAVSDELDQCNAFEKMTSIKIPIYFFAGEYDYTCCESLQREYFEILQAPEKKYYFYPGVAHSPVYENDEMTDRFLDEIISGNTESK